MAKIPEHIRKQKRAIAHSTSPTPIERRVTEPVFKHRLLAYFFVRFHMTLVLGGVILSGVGASKLLLELGVRSMLVRYPIAVCVAYAAFFLLVRLWLWYVGIASGRPSSQSSSSSGDGIYLDYSSGGGNSSEASWSGFGGGQSGGGGATDNWDAASVGPNWMTSSEPLPANSGSSFNLGQSSPSGKGGSFDFGDADEGCLVIVLLILLLLAIGGGAFYLVYQAPAILAEAAFEAALAAGLIKSAKHFDEGNWFRCVLKSTAIPFAIVIALAIAFGWAAHRHCPAATKAAEVFAACQ